MTRYTASHHYDYVVKQAYKNYQNSKTYTVSHHYDYAVNQAYKNYQNSKTYTFEMAHYIRRELLIKHYTKELERCPKPKKKKLYAKIRKFKKTNRLFRNKHPELLI